MVIIQIENCFHNPKQTKIVFTTRNKLIPIGVSREQLQYSFSSSQGHIYFV